MRKNLLLFFLFCFATLGTALGQNITVKGTVLDENSDPVMGATVRLKSDATKGAITDMDGRFTLQAKSGETILITYVGYKDQEVKAAPTVTVRLVPDNKLLDEVMVVAYGTAKKESFTGSATVVSGEKLSQKSVSNITKALEGEAPGIQVVNRTGQPGSSADIVIRGIGSVNSHTSPLYVVDGIPYGGSMSGINPNDIESISILKDASATALYGSRAANGVVLITTQKGKDGKTQVDLNLKYGITERLFPMHDGIRSPEEYMELAYQSLSNRYDLFKGKRQKGFENATINDMLFSEVGIYPGYNIWTVPDGQQLIDPKTGKFNPNAKRIYTPESWVDETFRTGQRVEGDLQVTAGTSRLNVFTSLGFLKEQGYLIGSDFQRFNVRNNLTYIISDNLKLTSNLAYSRSQMNGSGQTDNMNNGFNFANAMPAIYPVFLHDEKGNLIPDSRVPGRYLYDYGQFEGGSRGQGGGINPVGSMDLDAYTDVNHNVIANTSAEWRFLNDFKLTVNAGYQYNRILTNSLTNPLYGDAKDIGRLYRYSEDYYALTLNQILSWKKSFGDHNFDAFVAHESYNENYGYNFDYKHTAVLAKQLEMDNFVVMGDISSYSYGYALESYFGQLQYDYDGKYFINGSLRADGSSRFAPDKRWGTFGSVGGAWLISAEDFMKSAKWVNELKLKASWGLIGNQSISLGYDSEIPNYFLDRDFYNVSNLGDKPSFSFYSKGNPSLTWEKSSSWNVGLESRLFDRLNIAVEWFYKETSDMLFKKQVAPSLGYAYYPRNDGKLLNTGIELDLSYNAVKTKDWDFNIRLNMSHYANKITQMPTLEGSTEPKLYENRGAYGWMKDHSIYDHYTLTWMGVNPENGQAQYKAYRKQTGKQEDGTPIYSYITDMQDHLAKGNTLEGYDEVTVSDSSNAVSDFVGKSALPDLTGGFGFDLRFRDITLSSSFAYGIGGWAMDGIYRNMMHSGTVGSYNWHTDMRRAWTPTNKDTDVPALAGGLTSYSFSNSASTRFLTSRSFLTLSNVRLSYDLPSSWMEKIKMRKMSVFVSGDNLFILTARPGFYSGTSISGGNDNNTVQVRTDYRYIPSANVVFGINMSF